MELGDKLERIRDTLRKAARDLALLKGDFDNDADSELYSRMETAEDDCDTAADSLQLVIKQLGIDLQDVARARFANLIAVGSLDGTIEYDA